MRFGYIFTSIFCSYFLCTSLQGQSKNPTLFDFLHDSEQTVSLIIETDYKRILRRSLREEYEDALFILKLGEDTLLDQLSGRIRSRGNIRKEVCKIPPFKLDLNKYDLETLGFDSLDNLKLVLPCTNKPGPQERLYKEKLAYDLYAVIDSNAMRTILVEVTFKNEGKILEEMVGFFVEDEKNYLRRKNARLVGEGKIIARNLDRQTFLKMTFFQYMIANTDWAVSERHNLELIKLPDKIRVVAIPYDFDYSGFVNQPYAVPHSSLPIKSVTERYFHPYRINKGEFQSMVRYFKSKEDEFYKICDKATYMREKSIKQSKEFLAEFFKLLNKESWIKEHAKD